MNWFEKLIKDILAAIFKQPTGDTHEKDSKEKDDKDKTSQEVRHPQFKEIAAYIEELITKGTNNPFTKTPYKDFRESQGKNRSKELDALIIRNGGKLADPYCFTKDVQILTEKGFVNFDKLENGVKVAQVDQNNEITFVVPSNYIEKEYDGDGFFLNLQRTKMICDAGHRFWGNFNNKVNKEFNTLDKVSTILSIPHRFSFDSKTKNKIDDEDLVLLAAFVSDGIIRKNNRIEISVSKQRKIDALEQMNYVSKYTDSKCYGRSKPLTHYGFVIPKEFENIFEEYKIFKWQFIQSFSKEQARLFLKSYMKFDGDGKKSIYTSSVPLLDQLIFLGYTAGYSCYSSNSGNSPFSGKPCYRVTYSESKSIHVVPEAIQKVHLKEKLYCVSVPNERIIVRYDMATPIVTGNCLYGLQDILRAVEIKFKIKFDLPKTGSTQSFFNRVNSIYKTSEPLPYTIGIYQKGDEYKGHAVLCLSKIDAEDFSTFEFNTSPEQGKIVERDGQGCYFKTRSVEGYDDMRLRGFVDIFKAIK